MAHPAHGNFLKLLQKQCYSHRVLNFRGLYSSHCLCFANKPDVKPAGKVKTFALQRFIRFTDRYIDKFENRFEKKLPKAFKIYKLFKDGVRDFFKDSKMYYGVATQLWTGGKTLKDFKRVELENYRQFPRDLLRVGPIVILLNIPVTDMLLPPIVYLFPRQLLCRHFWMPEQRISFGLQSLQGRIHTYPAIFNFMLAQSDKIKDVGMRNVFRGILSQLDDGEQADVEAILDCKDLFLGKPFGLNRLYLTHRIHMQWHIARSLGFSGRKNKLMASAQLMMSIDQAIVREGMEALSLEDLRLTCISRGLHVDGVSREELTMYLQRWTTISTAVDTSTMSLLLHSPVLLGYNHPSNKRYLIKSVDVTQGVIKP